MDIERPNVKRNRWIRRTAILLVVAGTIGGGSLALTRLEPASPGVERETLLIAKVSRGVFLREVQGIGTLAPEEETWVTASIDGAIASVPLKPGTLVHPDTVLVELRNPSLDLDLLQAQAALKSAEVDLQSKSADAEDQILTMKSDISELEDQYKITQLQSSGDEEMSQKGFLPPVKIDLTKLQLASIQRKIDMKKQNLTRFESGREDKLAVARGQVEQAKAMLAYKTEVTKLLQVRAGVEGVLMAFTDSVGLGKRVGTGTVLAKVVDPSRLKAELKVSEQQARDLAAGLAVHMEILNQTIEGKVSRINPGVIDGNVAVDVTIDGTLPQGARPDLSITGVIEIERIAEAVYIDRPVSATANSTGQLFRINEAEKTAIRVPVTFGRTSATTIEIVKGLNPGDEAIVSDMSRWDNSDKLKIE